MQPHQAMRLGINAVRLTRPFTGVGRALECILDEWSRMDLPFERVTLFAPRRIDPGGVIFPLGRFELQVGGPRGPDPYWEARFLTPRARELDVLFAPSYTRPLGYAGPCVVANHGPSEHRPLSCAWWRGQAYERLYRHSARRASHVVACSRAVKRRIVEDYGVPGSRVSVAWNAPSRLFTPVRDERELARARERYAGGHEPFALFVGKLVRRHSIPELVQAFARARARAPRQRLVLVGPDVLGLDLPRLAARAGLAEAVRHHAFVPHGELPALYSAAQELVYPASAAEGFGLPIVEAMACGTPVLSVAQGGVPEFASGAALLVARSSPEELGAGLERLFTDAPLRQELSRKGLARAASISWRVTAERILAGLLAAARAA